MLASAIHDGRGMAIAQSPAQSRSRPAWREVEIALLALLVLGVYFSRLTDLTIRGEESRWARVAQEMLDSGDWIVPRQQGQPFPDRPPLNSWAMIAASKLSGRLDLFAIRLPSALATLLTTLAIYLYGRSFLSRVGAFAAAAAYATMGQVLQLGRVAESDAMLTLCLAGALFCWHYAYAQRGDPRLAWLGGYALAALAALAKGPQGPVYFLAITATFLALQRDWRFLFSRWHLAGWGLFIVLVGSWQLPFVLSLDASVAHQVWSEGGNVAARFQMSSFSRALSHWGSFPFEVLAAMLPWSFLLPVLATRWFRENLGSARPAAVFLATACAVAFPTCWLPIESRPRYLMSLYPCVALLVGLVVERSWQAQQFGWWRRSWDQFLLTGVGLVLGAPVVLALLHVLGGARFDGVGHAVSRWFVLVYGVAALLAAAAALWSRLEHDRRHAETGILALAGFLGLSYTGVVVNMQIHTSNDPQEAVAAVRELIPDGDRLVSFGPIHHLFAYYYQQPIEFQALAEHEAPADTDATYFCFAVDPGFVTPRIPFAWEQVVEISCERARSSNPRAKIVVGKRVAEVADAADQIRGADSVSPASFTEPASGTADGERELPRK